MDELIQAEIEYELDIPFKEFSAGQVIQSKQFNDDMRDVEDKVNEIVTKYNIVVGSYKKHIVDYNNPHQVTANQTGAYTIGEVDTYIDDLRAGNFNDNSITNRVLGDDCVETRNVKDGSITSIKVEESFGSQLNISQNIDIINRYTKGETDEIIKSKVGDGTYTKEEIDNKLGQVQAGQIVDKSIGINQLKTDVGELIDISQNASIKERYTKDETDYRIKQGALPRDWGSIAEDDEYDENVEFSALPITDVATCGLFKASISKILDVDIAEVVEARGTQNSLPARIDIIESVLDAVVNMFNGVIGASAQMSIEPRETYSSLSDRLNAIEFVLDSIISMFSEVVNYEY